MSSRATFRGPIGFTRNETRAAALLGLLLLVLLSITIYLRQTRPTEVVAMETVRVIPVTAPVAADQSAKPSTESSVATFVGDGLLEINTADYADLLLLPGVGPVLAGRIIDYRNEHGAFKLVAGLTNVAGIGEVKLDRLRSLIIVR